MAYLNEAAQPGELLWKDRKHWLWFPFSFTKYRVQDDRLMLEKGFFKTISDETLIYRIIDIKLERTLGQKLCGTGTICLRVRGESDTDIHLENIKRPKKVKQVLSHLIEQTRARMNVVGREFYGGAITPGPHGPGMDDDGHFDGGIEHLDMDGMDHPHV